MSENPGMAREDIDRASTERAIARSLAGIWEELRVANRLRAMEKAPDPSAVDDLIASMREAVRNANGGDA